MSSWIDPRCGMPEFTMESAEVASMCGNYSGYIFAGVLSIIILAVAFSSYYRTDSTESKDEANKRRKTIILVSILSLVFVWLIFPWILGFFAKRRWQTFDAEISSLESKGGLSREEAMKQAQSIWASELQAGAISGAGANIGGSILASSFNRQ